jgi:hypothetical protein
MSAHPPASGTETHQGDAHVLASGTETHQGNAHVLASGTETHQGNAHVLASGTETHQGNAHVLASGTETHQVNAHLLASGTETHQVNAHLLASGTETHQVTYVVDSAETTTFFYAPTAPVKTVTLLMGVDDVRRAVEALRVPRVVPALQLVVGAAVYTCNTLANLTTVHYFSPTGRYLASVSVHDVAPEDVAATLDPHMPRRFVPHDVTVGVRVYFLSDAGFIIRSVPAVAPLALPHDLDARVFYRLVRAGRFGAVKPLLPTRVRCAVQ